MNDYSEGTWAQEVFDEILEELSGTKLASAVPLIKLNLPAFDQLTDWRVASLSEDGDMLSQWRSYCPRGGVSLGFDREALMSALLYSPYVLRQCKYDRASQVHEIRQYVLQVAEAFTADGWVDKEGPINGLHKALYRASTEFKDHHFHEEREWRIVTDNMPAYIDLQVPMPEPQRLWRATDLLLIPYCEVDVKKCLRMITLGPKHVANSAMVGLFKELLAECGAGAMIVPSKSKLR